MKFTDGAIAKLPPPRPGRKDYWCSATQTPHLALRVTAKSKLPYFKKRPYLQPLGKFPAVDTAAMIREVKVRAGKVAAGIDLQAEKAAKKAKQDQARADAAYTLGDLISDWEKALQRDQRPSYANGAASVVRRAYAKLLDRPAHSITEEQLEEARNSLTSGPVAVRMAGEKARTLYNWGVQNKKVKDNPAKHLVLGKKRKPRQNFLTGEEARLVWRAAGTLPAPYGPFIKYLLGTLLRLREGAGMRRREFSPDLSEANIPGERMKEGEPHVVWLPPILREMLRALPRFEGTDLVFTADGKRAVSGFTHLKKKLDKALAGTGVKPFTFHDFRRSGTTWLVRNGTDSIVADRMLAHVGLAKVSAVASTYNIYGFEAERRAALERWVAFLADGKEVEALPSPRLLLPAPEPESDHEAAAAPPSVALSFMTLAEHAQGVTQALARKDEVAARFVAKITDILTNPTVMAVNEQILKAKLSTAFREKHRDNPPKAAFLTLAHSAARLALNDETVLKRSEVEMHQNVEEAKIYKLRANAKRARAEAEQARAMGREEFACEADARAQEIDARASHGEQMLQAFITTDDPRCVEYRPEDAAHASSIAKGVALALRPCMEEIFGNEHATWAAAYATAAVGWKVSRDQGRRRPKAQATPLKSVAR